MGRRRGRVWRRRRRCAARDGRQLEQQLQQQLEHELELELLEQFVEQLEQQLVEQFELQFELELLEQLELQFELELVEQLEREEAQEEAVLTTVRRRPRTRQIEFLCAPEDLGVVAEPVPARTALPGWFRRLPGLDQEALDHLCNGLTVKRCVPFLDALTTGWIVPLAATVRLEVADGGATVHAGWEFDRELVSPHGAWQATGNPWEPRALMKFHNPWAIRTPPGWSCLFTAPLNHKHDVVQILSGVVDTDRYHAPVNFPFVTTAPDGVHTLEKGTPLVQVIPFQRSPIKASVRAETPAEADERERQHRSTLAGAGWYRAQRKENVKGTVPFK